MREIEKKIETIFDAAIYSKSFKKLWNFGQSRGIFRWMTRPLTGFMQNWFHYKIKDYKGYAIALSHLDAAWLWTVNDSKVRAYKTFYKGIEHIKKYPYFSISLTSPQYYEWIKEYDEHLWNEVKKYVNLNKIDACGGSWVEPDLNIPSGEALVRQRLYGQLYYLRNFGKISKVECLLDVFGYPNNFPQILLKSGADTFWTTKLTWNDYTIFPFANFLWRGPDGSEIFTHMFKFNIMAMIDLGLYKHTARIPAKKGLIFNSHKLKDCEYISVLNLMGTRVGGIQYNSLQELEPVLTKEHIKTLGLFYGLGDGGKGPIEPEIGLMENLGQIYGMKHTTTHNYFRILKKEVGDQLVIWDDELYLEFHRGVLTTQCRVKKGNRLSENLTISAEILNTLLILSGVLKPEDYNKLRFWDAWQKILFNQFHDILPGSSIPEVYLLTWKEHDYVIESMRGLIARLLLSVYKKAGENTGDGILIFNPVPVKSELIVRSNGNSNETNSENDKNKTNLINLGSIESLDCKFIPRKQLLQILNEDVKGSDKRSYQDICKVNIKESENFIQLSNSKINAIISKRNGNCVFLGNLSNDQSNFIYDIYPKEPNINLMNTESDEQLLKLLKMKGTRLKVYHEPRFNNPFPAWNISRNFSNNPVDIKYIGTKIRDHSVISSYTFGENGSKAEIIYEIYPNSESIEVSFYIDMKDPEYLVKFFIPLNLKSEEVVSETQFATITRKRNPKTKMEKAKWEMPMQKWIDISDENRGLAIINRDRYGFSANMKGVFITLVRTPIYPESGFYNHQVYFKKDSPDPALRTKPKFTDLEKHFFRIRLIPHRGDWRESSIPQKAISFNNPVIIIDPKEEFCNSMGDSWPSLHPIDFNRILQKLPMTSKILKTDPIETEKILEEKILKSNLQITQIQSVQSSLSEMAEATNEILNNLQSYSIKITRFVSNAPNIIISSIKPSEWITDNFENTAGYLQPEENGKIFLPENESDWSWEGKRIILRAYESMGIPTECLIELKNIPEGTKIEEVYETNLLEISSGPQGTLISATLTDNAESDNDKIINSDDNENLTMKNNNNKIEIINRENRQMVKIKFKSYELKTILIKFS